MIVCPERLPDRALVRIRLRGLTAIDGKIVWQHRGHAGIRFSTPLHKALIEHLGFTVPDQVVEVAPAPASFQALTAARRSASGLHAQLVKRTWQDDSPDKVASLG